MPDQAPVNMWIGLILLKFGDKRNSPAVSRAKGTVPQVTGFELLSARDLRTGLTLNHVIDIRYA